MKLQIDEKATIHIYPFPHIAKSVSDLELN